MKPLLFLIAVLALAVSARSEEFDRNTIAPVKVLGELDSQISEIDDLHSEAAIGKLSLNLRYTGDLLALAYEWNQGNLATVELTWWRAHERDSRVLALILFRLKYGDGDISIAPDFERDLKRFDPQERNLRAEEFKTVAASWNDVKPKIEQLLKRLSQRTTQERKAQQSGADQPATKPADKPPADVKPPAPTSKDAPSHQGRIKIESEQVVDGKPPQAPQPPR